MIVVFEKTNATLPAGDAKYLLIKLADFFLLLTVYIDDNHGRGEFNQRFFPRLIYCEIIYQNFHLSQTVYKLEIQITFVANSMNAFKLVN